MEMGERDVILPVIERLLPILKQNGGYIFASDHSLPPHISFEDMCLIVDAYKKYGAY